MYFFIYLLKNQRCSDAIVSWTGADLSHSEAVSHVTLFMRQINWTFTSGAKKKVKLWGEISTHKTTDHICIIKQLSVTIIKVYLFVTNSDNNNNRSLIFLISVHHYYFNNNDNTGMLYQAVVCTLTSCQKKKLNTENIWIPLGSSSWQNVWKTGNHTHGSVMAGVVNHPNQDDKHPKTTIKNAAKYIEKVQRWIIQTL